MGNIKLTKEEAIEEHRKMWNYIADECLKQKKVIMKSDYFIANGRETYAHNLLSMCFLCTYMFQATCEDDDCQLSCYTTGCILNWPANEDKEKYKYTDPCMISYYREYNAIVNYNKDLYKKAAEIARKIANLEVNEDFEKELNKLYEKCN